MKSASPILRVAIAAAFAVLAAACTKPPAEPAGTTADFDAPRPGVVASLLGAAANREARGDVEGALRYAERAHATAPRSGAATLREAELRAWVAIRAGDAAGEAEARADVERLAAEHPGAPSPRLALARLALGRGDAATARAEVEPLVAERPDWAAAQSLLSRAVLADDPRRALELAERAVSLAPSDPDALGARAHARSALGQDRAAESDARRALRSRRSADLVEIVARARLRAGDARGAAREIESTLEVERTSSLERVLARAKAQLGDRDGAEAALVRAKTRAGDDVDAQVDAIELSAELAFADERAASALAEIEAARALDPADARLAELAANAQLELGRPSEAEANARRALELAPERASAWYTLARALEKNGVRPPAFERARSAVGGSEARAHALAGLLAVRSGDVAEARRQYEAAVRLDPKLAFASLSLSDLLYETDPRRALDLAEGAHAAMGSTPDTERVLGVALHANERTTDAIAHFRMGIAQTEPASTARIALDLALAAALIDAEEISEARRITSQLVAAGRRMDPKPGWLAAASDLHQKTAPATAKSAKPPSPTEPAPEPADPAEPKPEAPDPKAEVERPAAAASNHP